jgi:hypothetical protein
MRCVLLISICAAGFLLPGCGSEPALSDASTCANWLRASAYDQGKYVKQRRTDLGYQDSVTIAELVERRCQALSGSAGGHDEPIGPLIDDAVATHQAYTSG